MECPHHVKSKSKSRWVQTMVTAECLVAIKNFAPDPVPGLVGYDELSEFTKEQLDYLMGKEDE